VLTSQYPGFEKRRYIDTVDLPYRCIDWHFTWTNGARNSGVKNLCSASSYSITVDCHFNNLFSNQSSPRFTVLPIPYLCINQLDQFFNGPFDPNNNTLVVENIQPIGCTGPVGICGNCDAGGGIPYNPTVVTYPYSLINPVESSTAYMVDPLTGIATFTPTDLGKFVIAFKVSKYDPISHVFLGSTRRDVQVSVLNCNAPPPTIDTVPQNVSGGLVSGTTIYACPGSSVSFTMKGGSPAGANNIFLKIDTSISNTPGNVFTVTGNGSANVNGTFTWTPGDTSIGVHSLTFAATDSTCNNSQPILLKSYLGVTIKVVSGINAIPKIYRSCPLSTTPITLNVVGLPPTFTYSWTDTFLTTNGIMNPNTANPTVMPKDTTWYIVTVPNLPPTCKIRDTVYVNVDTSNHISITPATPVILCQPGTLRLTGNPIGKMPNSNLPCGVPVAPDLTIADSTIIIPSLGAYAGSTSNTQSASPLTANGSAHHQYLLRSSDMLNSGMVSGVLSGLSFSVRQVLASSVYNNVTIALSCTPVNTLNADGSLFPAGTQVFSGSVSIAATGFVKFPFSTFYDWDTTQNLLIDICYSNAATTAIPPGFDYYTSGYASSTFNFNDAGNVCNGAIATTGGFPLYELPVIRLNYFDAPIVPFGYSWQRVYGSNLFSDSTTQTPTLYIDQSSRYYVVSRGKSGCTFRDSVSIYLDPPRHPYVLPFDTTVCVNTPVQFVASNTKNGYKWYQYGNKAARSLNCDTCQTVIAIPDTSYKYTVVFTDTVKCIDTAFASVTAIPYPRIKISPRDTTIKYGSGIMLTAVPQVPGTDYKYVWNPQFTLDNPYLVNPTATPTVPTTYTVIAYNQFCPSTDTVTIGIDYRSNIFVPSAFTPNHDGKNDVFRIANLTYQRVIEFKIFNRWGQQIFNSTDNKGWDGTWNGNLMDIGVYNYIIRVIYPDGVEDSFNGNVTLIR
jgi:gliding motility-associated-like protein